MWFRGTKADQVKADEAKAVVADQREYFDRAVLRTTFAQGPDAAVAKQALIEMTRREFDRLEQKAAVGDSEGVEASARALARMRVYVWPREEARQEAAAMLSAMDDWGVPRDALERMASKVARLEHCEDAEAKAILYQLYADHDYWFEFIDWLFDRRRTAMMGVIPLVLVSAALSFWWFGNGSTLLGFVAAAASGSATSVMQRLPPIAVYRRVADFWARAAQRFVSGVMAAMLGLGCLQAGVLVLPLPQGADVASVFNSCALGCGWAQSTALFAVAMALGFTERLLSSLGESMLGVAGRARASGRDRESNTMVRGEPGGF
jgi:hypothetical protein